MGKPVIGKTQISLCILSGKDSDQLAYLHVLFVIQYGKCPKILNTLFYTFLPNIVCYAVVSLNT